MRPPLFAARGVHVAAASLEPLRNAMHFDEIRIDQPVVGLARDKQGVLNVEKLAVQPAAASKAAEGKPAASGQPGFRSGRSHRQRSEGRSATKEAPPLDLTIRHFAIDGGTVNVDDRVPATPTALSLTKLAATLDGFTMQGKTPAKYTLSTSLSRGGDVTAAGSFNLAEKQVESKLTVAALALGAAAVPRRGDARARRARRDRQREADWGKTPLATGCRQHGQPEVAEDRDARCEGARDRAATRARRSRRSTWPRASRIASVDVSGCARRAAPEGRQDRPRVAGRTRAGCGAEAHGRARPRPPRRRGITGSTR